MSEVLLVVLAVAGLVAGLLVNVIIDRVPAVPARQAAGDGAVAAWRCRPVCGHQLRAWDGVPLISWLLLRGRCRDCGERISIRYSVVEVLTAAVFVLLGIALGPVAALPAFLYLGAVGVVLAVIDLDVRRLPNVIVLPSYAVALGLLGVAAVVEGDWAAYGRAVVGMAALFGFYFLLAFIHPAGMGFGDVKLAGVLGLYLGWLGFGVLLAGAFLGFLFGALVGLVLLASRRATRRTAIPFGPYMLLGALAAILWGESLVTAYLGTGSV